MRVPFVVLRAIPDELRGEVINVGLVAFLDEGPRVYFDAPKSRLRALHPDLESIDGFEWARDLEHVLSQLSNIESQLAWLNGAVSPIRGDANPGFINVSSLDDATAKIEDLLERLVLMPARRLMSSAAGRIQSHPRLHTQLRSWFRTSRIFSSRTDDLSNGLIVSRFPINVQDDLYADFALKGRVVHVIETFDFRGTARITKSTRGEVGFKAVMLDSARRSLSTESMRIAVTASDDYHAFQSLTHLIKHYADDIIAVESNEDRQRLADFLAANLRSESAILPFSLEAA